MSEKPTTTMEEVDELEPEDYDYTAVATLHDSVSFTRGLGNTGREVYIVEKECEQFRCFYDRQVQTIRMHPEGPDTVSYECQNPRCTNSYDAE
jgi:hypothetical protein